MYCSPWTNITFSSKPLRQHLWQPLIIFTVMGSKIFVWAQQVQARHGIAKNREIMGTLPKVSVGPPEVLRLRELKRVIML